MKVIKYRGVQDIADELGVDVQTVRRWIQSGKLRAFKPGKEYRIQEADLEEFLRAREVRPKADHRSSPELSLFNSLEDERRLQYLQTWESFIRQLSGRWHARIAEREELGLELEAAWADELGDLYLELGQVVIQGLLRGWDESTAPEREKNLMKSIARTLDYLGEVWQEASRRTQTQQHAERRKAREAAIRLATEEIQRRIAG